MCIGEIFKNKQVSNAVSLGGCTCMSLMTQVRFQWEESLWRESKRVCVDHWRTYYGVPGDGFPHQERNLERQGDS